MYEQRQLKKTDREGVVSVNVEQFSKWMFKILDIILNIKGSERTP